MIARAPDHHCADDGKIEHPLRTPVGRRLAVGAGRAVGYTALETAVLSFASTLARRSPAANGFIM